MVECRDKKKNNGLVVKMVDRVAIKSIGCVVEAGIVRKWGRPVKVDGMGMTKYDRNRAKRIDSGRCARCGVGLGLDDGVVCGVCRDWMRRYYHGRTKAQEERADVGVGGEEESGVGGR